MTTNGADSGGPSGLEASTPEAAGRELDGYGLPPPARRTYLFATACLIGGIVGLMVALGCAVGYADHSRRADGLAFLGQAIGVLASIGGLAGAGKHSGGVNLVFKAAGWLGAIVFIGLLAIYGGKHGWSA